MKLKVVFVSLLTLLVALAVNPANASPNHDQILKLNIGKFSLTCTGDCSTLHGFRDKGILKFGTKEKMISNKDDNETIYTFNIINDYPDGSIPYYCADGVPQVKIGTLIYKNKPVKNTFKFLITAIDFDLSLSFNNNLESLIKKCGDGRIWYEILAEVLIFILKSFSNFFSILVCTHPLSYKRGVNK